MAISINNIFFNFLYYLIETYLDNTIISFVRHLKITIDMFAKY